VELTPERKAELLSELRKNLHEIERMSAQSRSMLDELDGTKNAEIERRVAEAIAALRAKSRAKKLATAKLPPGKRS
jgi:enoyl reductase-like protein